MHPLLFKLIQPGRGTTLVRRCITIPSYFLAATLVWSGLPLWLLVALILDALRDFRANPRRARLIITRLTLFGACYLAAEIAGIVIAFGLWCAAIVTRPTTDIYRHWNFRLQCHWGTTLLRAGQLTFGFHFEISGKDAIDQRTNASPIFLLLRHSSLADTVLAVSQISHPFGIHLRYVLKRTLLMDPCLDIVGQRLVNLFVVKGTRRRVQIDAVAALASNLGLHEGVLIYPEGTRFTSQKRSAHLLKLERRGDIDERNFASSLDNLLPPIRGGVMALLEVNPTLPLPADVVFCAHAGFEGSATVKDLLAGDLLHRTVRVHFWRVPHQEIPSDPDGRLDWLRLQWRRLDRKVTEMRHTPGTESFL